MRILLIGGTKFVGPYVTRLLVQEGHEVTLLTRGKANVDLPPDVKRLVGDRRDLSLFLDEFKQLSPDVVLDMIPMRQEDARSLMHTFRGIGGRVIGLSSIDVYLAFGRIKYTELGPIQPVPLSEEAELRHTKEPHGLDYDKTGIEQEIMGDSDLPGTILRLPGIHGPLDPLHRLYPYLKRMDDRRSAILINRDVSRWRFSRGYVENVAAAIVLAVTDDRSKGRIYNVAEPEAFSEKEWISAIGNVMGWEGEIVEVSSNLLPEEDDVRQDWVVDTYRIRQELGYHEVISREDGLRKTIGWERTNPPLDINPENFNYAEEDALLAKIEMHSR